MRKTHLSSLLVGLLTLVGVSQVWAQSVKFTENYYRGYHVYEDAETRNFTILTLTNCNWMDVTAFDNCYLKINTNLTIPINEYQQCICRADDGSWAADQMEWFTTTYSVPAYSSASFSTNYKVKVYKPCQWYYAIRAAYFDFGEDTSNFWSGRQKDPQGNGCFHTASNCWSSQNNIAGTETFYGEKCALWAYGSIYWNENSADVDVVSMDNSTGSSELTTNRYGAFLASKTTTGPLAQLRCHAELYIKYSVTMSYHKIFTFDANEGTGSMAVQNIKNSGNLTTDTPTRTGYTFAGWNTAANGSGTAYTGGQAITATGFDKGAITLYAQWTLNDVNINQDADNSAAIAVGQTVAVPLTVNITRSQFVGGMYNTICFPFAMDADKITEVFGANCEVQALSSSDIQGNDLHINFEQVTAMEAGKPYLIKPASDKAVSSISGVTVTATNPKDVVTTNATFKGLFGPSAAFEANDKTILFVTANNTLNYPTNNGSILGMRAYLLLTNEAVAKTPARCVLNAGGKHTPTAIETPSPLGEGRGETFKFLENGQVILIINGEKYNAQGVKL